MGYYINPPNETKEAFLRRVGARLVDGPPNFDELDEGTLPVCLVDNGLFTAAAIAYSKRELEVFADTTNDPRPRWWYLVKVSDLLPVSDLDAERIER